MTAAREEILARVRAALADIPAGEAPVPVPVPVPREYRRWGGPADVELFAERVRDYHADVRRVASAGGAGAAVTAACQELGLRRIAIPKGLRADWRPDGCELVEDGGLTASELDGVDGAVTGCAVAIAQTGTIALDGRGQSGRRALTLVPDHHICVVEADQVVATVPEAVAALAPAVREAAAAITLVSGPSASSDIELSRVEGVHGPRYLVVIIAG